MNNIWKLAQECGFDDYELIPMLENFAINRASLPAPQQATPEPVGEPTTEQQTLIVLAKRLEASGLIHDLSLPSETSRELSWTTERMRGYYACFAFDADGSVTGANVEI